MKNLVSVVIPIYNKEKTISRCLDSVLTQTYTNLEILLINDGSTDDSLKIIKKYQDKRIKLFNLKINKGVSYARNMGIKKASGRYLAFLDADDYFAPNKIAEQAQFMQKKDLAFTYHDFYYHDLTYKRVVVPEKMNYEDALKNTIVNIDTIMIDLTKIAKQDIYMPDIIRGEDIYMGWNILTKIPYVYRVPKIYSVFCIKDSSTSKYPIKSMLQSYSLYKTIPVNFIKRWYYYGCFIKNALKKRRCSFEKNKNKNC